MAMGPRRVALPTLVMLACSVLPASAQERPLPPGVSDAMRPRLRAYLEANGKSPEEYIVSKFDGHDLVFLGEYHRIRHDALLVQRLIPLLYHAGVRNLGFELGCEEYQDRLDALLASEKYDDALVRWLMFQRDVSFGYEEYLEIYRAAWEFNRTLAPGQPRFRIVHLDYRYNYQKVRPGMEFRDWREVWHKGQRDAHMARVLEREVLARGEKALVFCGMAHAVARLRLPSYEHTLGWLVAYETDSTARLVERKVPGSTFVVCLHMPWPSRRSAIDVEYPVDGAIDAVMPEGAGQAVGFDVRGTPFGELTDTRSTYSLDEQGGFTLTDLCDGYVFQKHFRNYEGMTPVPDFVNSGNVAAAQEQTLYPEKKTKEALRSRTVEHYRRTLEREGGYIRILVAAGLE